MIAPSCSRPSEGLGPYRAFADDDARGVKVVVQGAALTQELGREDEVVATELRFELSGVADRHGGLDDHHRLRVDGQHIAHHGLDRLRVEGVSLRVVIGRGGDDDELGPLIGRTLV